MWEGTLTFDRDNKGIRTIKSEGRKTEFDRHTDYGVRI